MVTSREPLEGEFPDIEPVPGAEPVALSAVELEIPTMPLMVIAIVPAARRSAARTAVSERVRATPWFRPAPYQGTFFPYRPSVPRPRRRVHQRTGEWTGYVRTEGQRIAQSGTEAPEGA